MYTRRYLQPNLGWATLAIFSLAFFSLSSAILGQQTGSKQPSQNPSGQSQETDVVRISTNLVQIDAVVTDDKGKPVTNLRAEDFEILEDGKPQEITNFSYIKLRQASSGQNAPTSPLIDPPPDRRNLQPGQPRRIIAFVVDDLNIDFASTVYTRDALRKFVTEVAEPEDLIAIVRTASNAGVLQQLTNNKLQLFEAIKQIRFSFNRRELSDSLATAEDYDLPQMTPTGQGIPEQRSAKPDNVFDDFVQQVNTSGTFATLNLVIGGLRKLPGRKSVVLLSNSLGFELDSDPTVRKYSSRDTIVREQSALLVDRANRASVVIYTVDPRGLEMDISGRFFQQTGLRELADKTGGFMVRNTNDVVGGLRRIAEDLEGYYLIGYRPAESFLDSKTGRPFFRHLKVKVKPKGLRVRSRSGFVPRNQSNPTPTPRDAIAEALVSPFEGSGLRLRLTSLLSADAQTKPFMRSLIHVDARDLTFTQEPDGRQKATFDVAGATFNSAGIIVEKIDQTSYTMRVSEKTHQRLMQTGFVYTADFALKKPGAYQLRFSIRDNATQRVGSVGQFVLVPKMDGSRLVLSGLILRRQPTEMKTPTSGVSAPVEPMDPDGNQHEDVQSGPAVRRFKPGTPLEYAYVVYNAKTRTDTPCPQVTAQTRLFRDDKLIYAGPEAKIACGDQKDPKRLTLVGELQLSDRVEPGDYVLQILIKDLLASEKRRVASQWIDFEIVR